MKMVFLQDDWIIHWARAVVEISTISISFLSRKNYNTHVYWTWKFTKTREKKMLELHLWTKNAENSREKSIWLCKIALLEICVIKISKIQVLLFKLTNFSHAASQKVQSMSRDNILIQKRTLRKYCKWECFFLSRLFRKFNSKDFLFLKFNNCVCVCCSFCLIGSLWLYRYLHRSIWSAFLEQNSIATKYQVF